MNRKSLRLQHIAMVTLVALLGCAKSTAATIPKQNPIQLDSGLVVGKVLPSGGHGYFGIPFAAAPVRELRWREPQPVARWDFVFNADRKAPECIQNLRAQDINHYFGEEATSEDCLYLNVWTPPGVVGSKRPVIVWIYGGGFTIGSSGMANYDGENLARKGVIVVSFNYRLGTLGFLAHPELTRESAHRASGNYGLLDQVAALRWVRRNIAAFGGDENNVTVMGQSAGAMSVFLLQASALSHGLMHRVIGMSGGPGLGPAAQSLAESEQLGISFQRALKASSLADLRKRPADQLLDAQNLCLSAGCPEKVQIRPNIDGYFLSEDALARFAASRAQDVPALLGFTRDENWNELLTATTPDRFREIARQRYAERADDFLKLYPPGRDVNATAIDAVRDGGMATVMRTWAKAQRSAGKASVYMYVFSHPHPYVPGITFADHEPATAGAYHASEVPYFFQTLESLNLYRKTRAFTDYDRRLADQLSDCVVAFARSANPGTNDVSWPPYELSSEQLVEFGEQTRVKAFDSARMNFMATARAPFALSAPVTRGRGD